MKKWKRRQYVVNPGFQTRYVLGLLLIPVFMLLITGALTYQYNNLLFQMVSISAGPEPASQGPLKEISEYNRNALIRILLLTILTAVLLFLVGIYSSHKVVGPVVRFKKTIQALAEGEIPPKIVLRKGDFGRDLAEAINQLIESQGNSRKTKS
jgi:hypothetical protein